MVSWLSERRSVFMVVVVVVVVGVLSAPTMMMSSSFSLSIRSVAASIWSAAGHEPFTARDKLLPERGGDACGRTATSSKMNPHFPPV
jgi:hypothetical protein